MKSTIIENIEAAELDFPFMMKEQDGYIVLFESEESGVVVNTGGKTSVKIGEHRDYWENCSFKPFHGSVTLEN